MLASRARVRPWSARDSRLSSERAALSTPSSSEIVIRSGRRRLNSPFGPFTVTCGPSTFTSTPEGTVMGALPTRLISPNLAYDLAAEPAPTRLPVREQALVSRADDHTQAALRSGNLRSTAVDPVAGLGDPAQALDHRPVPVRIAKLERQDLAGTGGGHVVTVDVALFGEDSGDLFLQLRRRHRHVVVSDGDGVADPGEHVRDRIGHHDYHDAFLTPGSSPLEASSRTQIRHMPKSRK